MDLKFENSLNVIGYVESVKLTQYKNGNGAIANIRVVDKKSHNSQFLVMFTNANGKFKFDGQEYTTSSFKNIFVDETNAAKEVLVSAYCGLVENKYTNKDGIQVSTMQNIVRKIGKYDNAEDMRMVFAAYGIVENVTVNDDTAKITVGVPQVDTNGNYNGHTSIKMEADEKTIDKVIDLVENGKYVKFRGVAENKPIRNEIGDNIGYLRRYRIVSIFGDVYAEDIPDNIKNARKLAKRINRGQYVDVKTCKIKDYNATSASDDEDIDLDFD